MVYSCAPHDRGASNGAVYACAPLIEGESNGAAPKMEALDLYERVARDEILCVKKSTADTWNRLRDKARIESRLGLCEHGNLETQFVDPTNPATIVAVGYERVVYGDHGPYVEFLSEQIAWSSFGRKSTSRALAYYDTYYTTSGYVKAYEQLRAVRNKPNPPHGKWSTHQNRKDGYADYLVGRIYISADTLGLRDTSLCGTTTLSEAISRIMEELGKNESWEQDVEKALLCDEGYCFVCNNRTQAECDLLQLFGAPDREFPLLKKYIKPNTPLFLLNLESLNLMGIFTAKGPPRLGISPHAFDGKFNAQVQVQRLGPITFDKILQTRQPTGPLSVELTEEYKRHLLVDEPAEQPQALKPQVLLATTTTTRYDGLFPAERCDGQLFQVLNLESSFFPPIQSR